MSYHRIPHLFRRGNVFCFRMAVPLKFRDRFGMQEFKGSLKTTDIFTARKRCRILSARFESLIQSAPSMPYLSHDTIRTLARQYFQELLDEGEERIALEYSGGGWNGDRSTMIDDLRVEQDSIRREMSENGCTAQAQKTVSRVLEYGGMKRSDIDSEDAFFIGRAIDQARLEGMRILVAKFEGDFVNAAPQDSMFKGMQTKHLPGIPEDDDPNPDAMNSIKDIADLYCKAKKDKEWVPKTYMDQRRVLDIAVDLFGPKRMLQTLDKRDIQRFRDTLADIPSNYTKTKRNRDRETGELLSLSAILERGHDGERISAKTQGKYFGMFRTFLNWCLDEEYISAMPGPNIKVVGVTKSEAKNSRHPYSDTELKQLFASPLYRGCWSRHKRSTRGEHVFKDGKYWIPLIALYSGMRLGEIVQLRLEDVRDKNGVWYFDVCRGEGKQIKTESSVRIVPIHQKLISLGILEHLQVNQNHSGMVQQIAQHSVQNHSKEARQIATPSVKKSSKQRVFPDIQPGADGYHSSVFSKWFGRYAKSIGIKSSKTSFHSFRHNFRDAAVNAQVGDVAAKALMGHSEGSVHDNYGSGISLTLLKEAIDKIAYEIDV